MKSLRINPDFMTFMAYKSISQRAKSRRSSSDSGVKSKPADQASKSALRRNSGGSACSSDLYANTHRWWSQIVCKGFTISLTDFVHLEYRILITLPPLGVSMANKTTAVSLLEAIIISGATRVSAMKFSSGVDVYFYFFYLDCLANSSGVRDFNLYSSI